MIKVLVLISLSTLGSGRQVKFADCGSKGSKINTIDVTPCDSLPCVLHRNNNYTVTVNFTASEDTNTIKTVVHGIIDGVPVPFPVQPDACKDTTCPVKNGSTQTYTNRVFCAPEYPKIKLAVKWEVIDDNKQDLFCFAVPLSIQ